MRNQTSFRLTTTLLPTDMTAKTTQVINKVDENGDKFYPTFTEETIVLTNDDRTVMETARATASNGVLTFTKRGLSDDVSETQVANRKLTWNPGSLVFITAGAADWIDKDDSVTWTGNQTYTGELTSTNKATYKGQLITEKGVKYPNFADVTALQAYAEPFAGMFATVDDTGELYRYNAKTCCWDMVSSTGLATYTFVCCNTPPSGTANTVVTMTPNSSKIYLGDNQLVGSPKFADVLLVGGGGAWRGYGSGGGGGGVYLGEKVGLGDKNSFCICVGCKGCLGVDGGSTIMEAVNSVSGGVSQCSGSDYTSGCKGGTSGLNAKQYSGGAYCTYACAAAGGGGGARGNGAQGYSTSNCCCDRGGAGGEGFMSNISGELAYYGYGGGGSSRGTGGSTHTGWGVGGGATSSVCPGVAIVRYPTNGGYGIHCATGGTVTTCNGYTIHTFTSDGTFTIVN